MPKSHDEQVAYPDSLEDPAKITQREWNMLMEHVMCIHNTMHEADLDKDAVVSED